MHRGILLLCLAAVLIALAATGCSTSPAVEAQPAAVVTPPNTADTVAVTADQLRRFRIESPVERILIPFLDADWWSGYQPADAQRLPAYLKFLAEKGEPSETDFRLPAELGKGLEEILEHEKQYNFQSVQYTRALLARLKA